MRLVGTFPSMELLLRTRTRKQNKEETGPEFEFQ